MDVWQFKVRELLLRASEIVHHRSHEHFIFLLQTLVDALQFTFKLVQMWRHLT